MLLTAKRRIAAAAAVATVATLAVAAPAYAAALSSVGWSVSQPQPGTSSVRYTWTFTTATTGTIADVTMSVPSGTTGASLTVGDLYGLSTGTASLNTGTNTVTFTVTTPASVAAGTGVLISLDGFTNTSTANSYSSVVTTEVSGPATLDSGTSNTVAINDTSTAVKVVVAQSTAFSSDTTTFGLVMDPSVSALQTQTHDVALTVATNAANGYTLRTQINHQPLGANRGGTLGAVSGTVAGSNSSPGADTFGYTVHSSTSSSGSGSVQGQIGTGYAGYTAGTWSSSIYTSTGPTNSDAITLRNRAQVDYLLKADDYNASITYSVTPSY
ncbi:hypothetical protein [Actinoplanes sp. NPDC051851]|uniref:hypothetical protein n=1 Tax=Actinoplanes sp. NPDC051851 TaxID=3154753 RepID=UPI003434B831